MGVLFHELGRFQTGGDCWFYDNSQGKVTGQTGGDCRFYGNSQKVG